MKFISLLLLLVTYQLYGIDKDNIATYQHQDTVKQVLSVNTNKGPVLITNDGSNIYIWNKSELLEKRKMSDGQITSLQIQNTQKGIHILAVAGKNIHILETNILGNRIIEDSQNEWELYIELPGFFKFKIDSVTCLGSLAIGLIYYMFSKARFVTDDGENL